MVGPGGDGAAGRASAGPLLRAAAPAALDDALVVGALSRLAGAATRAGAADAVLPLLLDLPGVRAAAVVVRDGERVVVVGSAGYGCGPMSAGADLPLDAGLPVTECVRTGRTVVQGSGPSWVAVPFGSRTGALLLSMTTAPVQSPPELARLQRVARGLGDALHRAGRQERGAADLAVVAARLAVAPTGGGGAVVRSLPHDGPVGGDLALCLPDGRGGRWLLVADVCGSGLPAAVVARSVQATFIALAPYVGGPAELLAAADRALAAAVGPGLFVTALAAHEQEGRLRVASAGHPPLLLLRRPHDRPVEVEPGLPLALETQDEALPAEAVLALHEDDVLLLHSDGLLDRRTAAGPVTADPLALVHGLERDDLEALADEVLAAAEELGAQGDDVTLMLARPLR